MTKNIDEFINQLENELYEINQKIQKLESEKQEYQKILDELKDLKLFYEENERLKQQIEDLKFKIRAIKAYDRTAKEEHSDSVYDFQKKLEKW